MVRWTTVVPNRALQEIYLAAVQGGRHHRPRGHASCAPTPGSTGRSSARTRRSASSSSSGASPASSAPTSGPSTTSPAAGFRRAAAEASSIDVLTDAVATHQLAQATVDDDVERILTEMFAYGVVGRPATGTPGTPVDVPSHTDFATHRRRTVGCAADEPVGTPPTRAGPRAARWRSSAPTPPPTQSPRGSGPPTWCPRSPRPPWTPSPAASTARPTSATPTAGPPPGTSRRSRPAT